MVTFNLTAPQRLGIAAAFMTALAATAAMVTAVFFDVEGPAADPGTLQVPPGLIAAWAGIGVVHAAGLLSLLPPLLLSRGAAGAAPLGFMAGMMTRMFLTLVGALVGTLGLGLTPKPFLLALAVVYVVLLPAELIGLPRIEQGQEGSGV